MLIRKAIHRLRVISWDPGKAVLSLECERLEHPKSAELTDPLWHSGSTGLDLLTMPELSRR